MSFNQLPSATGLYRPEFEHDACGIGLYANVKGKASHDIVKKGLQMLCKLDHRGGQGSDPLTGDGAGIMVQIPDEFFRRECPELKLPKKGSYGVGMIFFTNDLQSRNEIEDYINNLVVFEGQTILGWRDVPVNVEKLGTVGKQSQPVIRQVFIGANPELTERLAFERKLYVIRKQVEFFAQEKDSRLYFASLSSQTIVYKGLLTPDQVDEFYLDLKDELFVSAFSLVHSRFSTNTFPSWERAHPNRYLIHNGEINTLRGNINWMKAREQQFVSEAFGKDLHKVLPVLDTTGSDSSMLDNAFEFFVLAGRSPAHTAMMLIPEPWTENPHISDEKRAFYQYHSSLMEPWDGPTAISFTNGKQIGAILDRNGLRPARYYVTKDDYIILSSEVGVIDVEESNILYKDRLSPGKMLLIDLEQGRIISDEEIKAEMANTETYQEWLDNNLVKLNGELKETNLEPLPDLRVRKKAFGYTHEDINKYLIPVVTEGKDPLGSMGTDTPLAVLSERPQSLFNYFKQSFAQVTNPPIDAIREHIVTSTMTLLGAEGNLLHPNEENARRIELDTFVLSNNQLTQIKEGVTDYFVSRTIETLFTESLEQRLVEICEEAEQAIVDGVNLLILSDRNLDEQKVAIPVLLAASAIHQHLVHRGSRTQTSILVESGEAREVHHFAALIGYGVDAINPYLVFEVYKKAIADGVLELNYQDAVDKYMKAITEGVVKVMSKMGISTVQSYRGAQIFEAVGLGANLINHYFNGTASQIGGIEMDVVAKEALLRHQDAYGASVDDTLDSGSEFQWRKNGEFHAFNPSTIHTLQLSTRKNDYQTYKKFSNAANEERMGFLRNMFSFNENRQPVPVEEVESVESILRRFKTGAMSFGSISQEAHEALAIAMNRIGAKSNSGEGGENPARYIPDANGDSRRSAIKQIASGRFGVKSHYLVNADELQIKMAQGAKPGEGGQLPGNKVYPWVAEVRGSTPGVGLISPPPHHDIYSIEDLAQLIHDMKNANRNARVSVKLVSKAGVGTIAAGVAKGAADVIVISGYDGGTGASPKTSIKHTGMPWELGLAEAHQTLMLNGLRNRVVLETDGKLMTGRDVVLAALLGAEEFGFATAPLVVLGCVMMRACHLDTCPVGVATQNPELRRKFVGDPDYIVNYFTFVAQEVREMMAELGFRTVEDMVGRTDMLTVSDRAQNHWKAKHLDLSALLQKPEGPRTFSSPQDHKIEKSLDMREILPVVQTAVVNKTKIDAAFNITNIDRVVGTIVGSEISKKYGEAGLPEDSITLRFTGSAGQSFGAFIPNGMTMYLTGDANDYIGKGLSGGKIIVTSKPELALDSANNVIAGNIALYGATSGEAYINGLAGERFCVRNSGADAVVEGVGDHGCEYMTGGRAVVLGPVGKNFAAGMSGGIAYLLSENHEETKKLCNDEMIEFETLIDKNEINEVRQLVLKHHQYTGSPLANLVLNQWGDFEGKFLKVIPKDYKRMMAQIEEQKASGLSNEEAVMKAFEANVIEQKAPSAKKELLETVGN
ncbi:glutamate synthase large subunit [Bacillus marasmi]|uniref:glutamate synthase large subunit n=1 Tax=Bacillus marasmi TaxID=1926279 RepID=UPI0011CA2C33|nr:glutamate synthase large subunit [Bacillus marasmi]